MYWTAAELSWTGPVRPDNQDATCAWLPEQAEEARERGAFAAIADGVGGQARGDLASRVAVEIALRAFRQSKPGTTLANVMRQVFSAAGHAVHHLAADASANGTATTLSVCILRHDQLVVGHIGDARVYLLHAGKLKQLTEDHNYAGVQLQMGLITPREAARSPMRHVLTRSLGREAQVTPDIRTATLAEGDRVILCTDGLHACVTAEQIASVAAEHEPARACELLIELASQNNPQDNASVVIMRVDELLRPVVYRGTPIVREPSVPPVVGEIEPGQTLDGRFVVEELVARSGMASIYRAQDLQTGQAVAIKAPFPRLQADPDFMRRFEQEEQIGLSLHHPSILKVLPVAGPRSRPYAVLEFLQGRPLDQVMHGPDPLPIEEALRIAARLCKALEYLHSRGVIHRDLKPHNVMICVDGTIRLMDFGISQLASESHTARRAEIATIIGTPDYISPEQVRGEAVDERSDIYSLGAMLYEMVVGRPPFEGPGAYAIMQARLRTDPPAPREIDPEIPPQVEEIILHAMAFAPRDRYPSAAALGFDLENSTRVLVTGRAARLRRPGWRMPTLGRRTVRAVILLALLLLAGAVVYLRWRVRI